MRSFIGNTLIWNILRLYRYYFPDKPDKIGNKFSKCDFQPEESLSKHEEEKSAEERYKATVLEANMYLEHDLYNESLFLYKKLEKEWSKSNAHEKINLIRKKILTLSKLIEAPFEITFQPDNFSKVLYMDNHGGLTEDIPESEEHDLCLSSSSRNLLLYKKIFPGKNGT